MFFLALHLVMFDFGGKDLYFVYNFKNVPYFAMIVDSQKIVQIAHGIPVPSRGETSRETV